MTKFEAIRAMQQGKLVTHKYFSPEEYITMQDGMIVTEEGYKCEPDEFWKWRTDSVWLDDWDYYTP